MAGRKNAKPDFKIGFSVHLFFHSKDFEISRPRGLGEFLFLHFLAPAKMLLRGETLHLPPGACFLYSPDEPQLYSGDGVGLGNNAFHCSGTEAPRLIAEGGIPLNTPLFPENDARIEALLELIHEEHLTPRKDSPTVCAKLFELLCLELKRQTRVERGKERLSPRTKELREKIGALRSKMLHELEKRWTLGKLAQAAGLGRSRFCALYKELWKSSPVAELLEFRLRRADYLLRGGSATVAEAAKACGFNSVQYFCRLYKRRRGVSPGGRIIGR